MPRLVSVTEPSPLNQPSRGHGPVLSPGMRGVWAWAVCCVETGFFLEAMRLAGHDRCPIPLHEDDIDAWVNPDPKDLPSLYAILDRRVRPFYEHRLAKKG